MKKIYYLIIFLGILSLTLEGAVIYLSNQEAGDSIEVSEMKREIAELQEKNRHLRREVLAYSSFKNIASKAAELGFEEGSEFISLKQSESFAAR